MITHSQDAEATISFINPQGIPPETASMTGLGFHTIDFDIQSTENYCNNLDCNYTFEAINLIGNLPPANFDIDWEITDVNGVYQNAGSWKFYQLAGQLYPLPLFNTNQVCCFSDKR
ncbi:MAG: hypothetical protein U5Q03_18135 [Bacteroidota bacterium]|nr:hypothetical protein [Bacteroidota bacterium]